MKENNDILKGLGQRPYTVPDGYFQGLQMRLSNIPQLEEGRKRSSIWMRLRPIAALVAFMLIAFVAGTAILRNTIASSSNESDELVQFYYADMIPTTDPYSIYDDSYYEEEGLSEEDIVDYLIESGTSIDLIASLFE